nr:DAK2 domain-containing protein [Streptomyces hokutonensis]
MFPSPDQDTGRNMLRFWETFACSLLTVPDDTTVGDALTIAAAGSTGFEGNSSTITYRWLTGLGESLAGVSAADLDHLAPALEEAARRARQRLADPVDGTMLTVFDTAARTAQTALSKGLTTEGTTARIVREARVALAQYPVPLHATWRGEPPEEDSGAFAARILFHTLSRTMALPGKLSGTLFVPGFPFLPAPVSGTHVPTQVGCELQAVVLADEAALGLLDTAPDVEALNIAEIPLSPGRWHLHLHTQRCEDPLAVLGEGITVVEHRITSLEPSGTDSRADVDGPRRRALTAALYSDELSAGFARALEEGANEILVVMVGGEPDDVLDQLSEARHRYPGLAAALIPCASERTAIAAVNAFSVTAALHVTVLAMFAASRVDAQRNRDTRPNVPRPR